MQECIDQNTPVYCKIPPRLSTKAKQTQPQNTKTHPSSNSLPSYIHVNTYTSLYRKCIMCGPVSTHCT